MTVKYVENPPQHVPRPAIVPCVVTQPQLATAEPSETSLSLAVSQVRSSTFAANQQQTPRFSLQGSMPAAAVNQRFTTLYINSSNTNSWSPQLLHASLFCHLPPNASIPTPLTAAAGDVRSATAGKWPTSAKAVSGRGINHTFRHFSIS